MRNGMNRWPASAAQSQCVLCGQPKMPSLVMCFECFQRNHVGKGQYTRDAERAMSRAENNLADDPFADVFDDTWDRMERHLGIKW